MDRSRVALIVLIAIAATLAVIGGLFVIRGSQLVSDADARVNAQNARGCGAGINGSEILNNCTTLAPGTDQPEGVEGSWFIATGEMLVEAAVVPAVGGVILLAWQRLGD